eukprot:scaffold46206_cov65-Attheya_sp.AAC.4
MIQERKVAGLRNLDLSVATNVAVPPLSEIWNDILIDNWRDPHLPPCYMRDTAPPIPALTPSVGDTISSGNTDVSGLTSNGGGTGATKQTPRTMLNGDSACDWSQI